jgi:hypothetical protein
VSDSGRRSRRQVLAVVKHDELPVVSDTRAARSMGPTPPASEARTPSAMAVDTMSALSRRASSTTQVWSA